MDSSGCNNYNDSRSHNGRNDCDIGDGCNDCRGRNACDIGDGCAICAIRLPGRNAMGRWATTG